MRKDAKRVRNINGLSQICIDLKPKRCDSDVFIKQEIDVTNLVKYIEKRKKEGSNITYFHAFVAAYGKMLFNRPYLNRFVSNRHVYEHNEVVISFVAKVSFDDRSEEVMVLVPIKPEDTLDTISEKILNKLDKIRNKKFKKEGANDIIGTIGKLPNILRVPIVGIFKYIDKIGKLPKSFVKDNIYYSSMIMSNLGSIHCGAIYHNITDFGTCSGITTIGEIKENKETKRKTCEFGINMDERVADGYYMVKSVKFLEYVLGNPELLEHRADEKIESEELR